MCRLYLFHVLNDKMGGDGAARSMRAQSISFSRAI
jgi:hypothetical protein